MSEWISVEDRLPRMWEGVLIASTMYWKSEKNRYRYSQYAYLVGTGWRTKDGSTIDPERERVTHWQPLPEPPAVLEKEK